jgi:hypothetical protein
VRASFRQGDDGVVAIRQMSLKLVSEIIPLF